MAVGRLGRLMLVEMLVVKAVAAVNLIGVPGWEVESITLTEAIVVVVVAAAVQQLQFEPNEKIFYIYGKTKALMPSQYCIWYISRLWTFPCGRNRPLDGVTLLLRPLSFRLG